MQDVVAKILGTIILGIVILILIGEIAVERGDNYLEGLERKGKS